MGIKRYTVNRTHADPNGDYREAEYGEFVLYADTDEAKAEAAKADAVKSDTDEGKAKKGK